MVPCLLRICELLDYELDGVTCSGDLGVLLHYIQCQLQVKIEIQSQLTKSDTGFLILMMVSWKLMHGV